MKFYVGQWVTHKHATGLKGKIVDKMEFPYGRRWGVVWEPDDPDACTYSVNENFLEPLSVLDQLVEEVF